MFLQLAHVGGSPLFFFSVHCDNQLSPGVQAMSLQAVSQPIIGYTAAVAAPIRFCIAIISWMISHLDGTLRSSKELVMMQSKVLVLGGGWGGGMVRFGSMSFPKQTMCQQNGIHQQFIEPGAVRCPPFSSSVLNSLRIERFSVNRRLWYTSLSKSYLL